MDCVRRHEEGINEHDLEAVFQRLFRTVERSKKMNCVVEACHQLPVVYIKRNLSSSLSKPP